MPASLSITPSEEVQTSLKTGPKYSFNFKIAAELILIGSIVLLGCFFRLINGPQPIDDAYITYRYVENIVSGNGFVYNVGQHVLGTTTPLYTLLLSLFYFVLRVELPWLSLGINTVADAITIVLLWRISRYFLAEFKVPFLFEFVTPLLFSIAVFSTNWCIGGMETSVFSLLSISCLYFFLVRKNEVVTATLASLTVICRPEGIVLVGLILGYFLIFQRKDFLKTLLVVLLVIVPWILFATFYFGNPIPQSVLAKTSAVYNLDNNFFDNFSYFWQLLIDNPIGQIIGIAYIPNGKSGVLVFITVINIALFLYGTLKLARLKDKKFLLIPGFAFSFIGIYAVSIYKTPAVIFPWYTGPMVPWLLLLTTTWLAGIWQHQKRLPNLSGRFIQLLVICLIIISVINQLRAYDNGHSYIRPRGYYEQVAGLLQPYLKKDDLIAASEIGELGYFSHARIMDTVGLVSPEVLKFFPVPESERAYIYTIPTALISQYRPDYVVSLDIFIRNSLLKSPDFLENYTLLQSLPNTEFNSDNLLIYVKNNTQDN